MSILIKGMEMPKSCSLCPMCSKICPECRGPTRPRCRARSFKGRLLNRGKMWSDREKWCSLIEIPPHGRLIDADALCSFLRDEYHGMISDEEMKIYKILRMLNDAPTIIEAEVDG